ncbi:MAG: hypothetical protein AAFQ65_02470 [Myxococcota bacterium]
MSIVTGLQLLLGVLMLMFVAANFVWRLGGIERKLDLILETLKIDPKANSGSRNSRIDAKLDALAKELGVSFVYTPHGVQLSEKSKRLAEHS